MLILGRKTGEAICLDGETKITVLEVNKLSVMFCIDTPAYRETEVAENTQAADLPSDTSTSDTSR